MDIFEIKSFLERTIDLGCLFFIFLFIFMIFALSFSKLRKNKIALLNERKKAIKAIDDYFNNSDKIVQSCQFLLRRFIFDCIKLTGIFILCYLYIIPQKYFIWVVIVLMVLLIYRVIKDNQKGLKDFGHSVIKVIYKTIKIIFIVVLILIILGVVYYLGTK